MPNGYKKHDKTLSRHKQYGGSSSHVGYYNRHGWRPCTNGPKIDAGKNRFLLTTHEEDYFLQAKLPHKPPVGGFKLPVKRAVVLKATITPKNVCCCSCQTPENVVAVSRCQHNVCRCCAQTYYGTISLEHYPLHCAVCPTPVDLQLLQQLCVLPTCFRVLTRLAQFHQKQVTHGIYQCPGCLCLHNIPRAPFDLETKCDNCRQYFITPPDIYCPNTTRYFKLANHCLRCNVHYFKEEFYPHRHNHIRHPCNGDWHWYCGCAGNPNNLGVTPLVLEVNLSILLQRLVYYETHRENLKVVPPTVL